MTLYQSIRIQLSVSKYQAISLGRGANLDSIDFALNDRVWLKNEFAKIGKAPREQQQAMIERIVNWMDAIPGGADSTTTCAIRARAAIWCAAKATTAIRISGFALQRFWRYRASQRRPRVLVHNSGNAGRDPAPHALYGSGR